MEILARTVADRSPADLMFLKPFTCSYLEKDNKRSSLQVHRVERMLIYIQTHKNVETGRDFDKTNDFLLSNRSTFQFNRTLFDFAT